MYHFNNSDPEPSDDPRELSQDPYNAAQMMETHLSAYLKNLFNTWQTQQEILQRSEDGKMRATIGFTYNLAKKNENTNIIGLTPSE